MKKHIGNGFKYSREKFEGYELQLLVHLVAKGGEEQYYPVTFYTTQKDVDLAWDDIPELLTDKVINFTVFSSFY